MGEWEGEIEGEGERGVGLWGGRERRRGRRAYPCIMLSRLTTRHPFGLSSACDHSSTLNRCWPGGGRGCAASGPGEPFTTLSLGGGGAFMTPHAARHTALPPPPRAHQLAVARPPAPPPAGTDGNRYESWADAKMAVRMASQRKGRPRMAACCAGCFASRAASGLLAPCRLSASLQPTPRTAHSASWHRERRLSGVHV